MTTAPKQTAESWRHEAADFIRNNPASFGIDDGATCRTCGDTTVHRRRGHSGVRPYASFDTQWAMPDGREWKRRIWVKHIPGAAEVFAEMQRIYGRLALSHSADPMPTPYACVPESNLVFSEARPGHPLYAPQLVQAIRPAGPIPAFRAILTAVGTWLRAYHEAMTTPESDTIETPLRHLRETLEADTASFSNSERQVLFNHLTAWRTALAPGDAYVPLTCTHNDFSMRNILVGDDGHFSVVDWDARLHPQFPQTASGSLDVTTFVLNLFSLRRFSPIARTTNLRRAVAAFLEGYGKPETALHMQGQIWFTALQLYLGLLGDRPLPEIYSSGLAARFIPRLHAGLLTGPATFLEGRHW